MQHARIRPDLHGYNRSQEQQHGLHGELCPSYIGGARKPLLLSSGLEDYFLGTYYFNKGRYHTPIAGLTHFVADQEFSAYRFHERDWVFFDHGLRLTVRAGEESNGKVFGPEAGPKDTDFTTYVWLYEW